MEKINFYLQKYKLYISIFIILIIVLIILSFIINKEDDQIIQKQIVMEEKNEAKIEINSIKVDVKGYVEKEGVYELNENSRVIDAINKAGGLKSGANTEYLNLSKKLVDEMIIIVYSDDQVEKFKEEKENIIYIEYKCECPDNINNSCITDKDIVNTNGTSSNISSKDNELISINNASLEDLTKLPGIGESKAKNIIKYREENGNFESLEELMNVSGIGESAYSKIKDYITL